MSNYSRRRRGYYGPAEPTAASSLGGQVLVIMAGLIILACLLTIAASFWTGPAFTDFKIRSRLN